MMKIKKQKDKRLLRKCKPQLTLIHTPEGKRVGYWSEHFTCQCGQQWEVYSDLESSWIACPGCGLQHLFECPPILREVEDA